LLVRITTSMLALIAALSGTGLAAAQVTHQSAPAEQSTACPPDPGTDTPTIGSSKEPLSDKLAQSKGVICPPTGVDPQIQVAPPGGGKLKVIPPPGTPGGDQSIQPK
jgi:hypothetical protein